MKILVEKLKIIRKRYESISLDQETALYIWYKIIIILMKLQTHQYTLGPVFMIFSIHVVLRR